MKLIVGLGNPGIGYAHTYHNMGFLALEGLAKKLNAEFVKKECDSLTAHTEYGGSRVILAKPQTFMNLSGTAVRKLAQYYKTDNADIIVLFDDIDIEKGAVRYRAGGSGGTHNGMRDIVLQMGETVPRVRIGIGKPDGGRDLASYVLGVVPAGERETIKRGLDAAIEKVLEIIGGTGKINPS